MKQKIQTILSELNRGLVEREGTLKLGLLSALAGENLLLIGPPGSAKSLVAKRIAESFVETDGVQSDGYFEYLLTKFSTPEEIFGPLSISELKADRYRRNTTGYLPAARIAFLDEIFKASSSILNALLTILNERRYHNGSERVPVPLHALIAASNELPTGQEELDALYDRFLLRSFVGYVSEAALPELFDVEPPRSLSQRLGVPDLQSIREAAGNVSIPIEVRSAIHDIWLRHREAFKEDRREGLSDRRLKKVVELLRTSAATNGRTEVDLSDVLLLKDCLWNHPDNAAKVTDLIRQSLLKFNRKLERAPAPAQAVAHPRNFPAAQRTVKGYTGNGTPQAPLLVGTLDELLGLHRQDVGQCGYHFRQTNDIDCSPLDAWNPITFRGCYDGAGFSIRTKEQPDMSLFGDIEPGSQIGRLNLANVSLGHQASKASIESCTTNRRLIEGDVVDARLRGCHSGASLIGGNAQNCLIERCQAGGFLVDGEEHTGDMPGAVFPHANPGGAWLYNCEVADCLVLLNTPIYHGELRAGIAQCLSNSKIRRCWVSGSVTREWGLFPLLGARQPRLSGFAGQCRDGSEIRDSALGALTFDPEDVVLQKRITAELDGSSALLNNIAIDHVRCTGAGNDQNSLNGRTVASGAFNQYLFEHTLNWDFETVWEWDAQKGRPALRPLPCTSVWSPAPDGDALDLLSEQCRANIWL